MASSINSKTPKIVGALVVSAIVVVGAVTLVIIPNKNKTQATTNIPTTSQPVATQAPVSTNQQTPSTSKPTATATPSSPTTTAKQGSYSDSTSYMTPEGDNTINVTVGVDSSGTITSVSTKHNYSDRKSAMYIQSFNSEVQSEVVGQKLSNVSPTRIGGASLTSQGFYDVLANISTKVNG